MHLNVVSSSEYESKEMFVDSSMRPGMPKVFAAESHID